MDKRIFVKKRNEYSQEALKLKDNLNKEYKLNLKTLDMYVVYDIYNIDKKTYELSKKSVFSEVMIDEIYENISLEEGKYFAYENLPAQYDQRADSAMQCIKLLNDKSSVTVKSGILIVFDKKISSKNMEKIEKYLVNPIESRVKNMNILNFSIEKNLKKTRNLEGFTNFTKKEMLALKEELKLALSLDDLNFIKSYFKQEKRNPTETEIYVFDCYWSDHCRHTTFETHLEKINIKSKLFKKEIQQSLDTYLELRKKLNRDKPITLMDMASITKKYHTDILKDKNIEVSLENNACSFFSDIKVNGKKEKWLIQFKNETHNHPTEIEPFGGASTCIGGAIRDPLSGRSFVYQAMRISGCANILEKREQTLKYKLPQVDISTRATLGNSSYGNQIGLATTYVKELYDESYKAKHMEVGAVVGASKVGTFKREEPAKGDYVILIGGRTGRDGIQGASGSSVVHDNNSLESSSSQVQKGNAIEERKLQRLFRNTKVTKMIKKCNDFGAGGVSVAVGELYSGVEINLDKILVKYEGLSATELAISESQERMAVVISPNDYEKFIKECEKENIEHSHIANITDDNRLKMIYNEDVVVDINYDFLQTNGVAQKAKVSIEDNNGINPFLDVKVTKKNILDELSSLNVTCQKGISQRFDSSISCTTVLMPFSGKNKLTPVQSSVQAIPTLNAKSDTATVLSYGFIPEISHYSPFLSATYSVLESLAKIYAVGANKDNLYFSFQEYFEKLKDDPKKWGKVTQSLLATIKVQDELNKASIGGKDSMSGTFNELNVVETLISFACATVKIEDVISPEFKKIGNYIYYIPVKKSKNYYPDIKETLKQYDLLNEYIKQKKIASVYVQEKGSIVASLVKMSLGNDLGFKVTKENILNFDPASMIVESSYELPFEKIGVVSKEYKVNNISLKYEEIYNAYTKTLNNIYPLYQNEDKKNCENIDVESKKKKYFKEYIDKVKVVIPVFPGTNCEYDSAKAFKEAGADVDIVVFRNKKENDIEKSIEELAKAIEKSHILMLAGGFSNGDEPDGSAKFIVNVLKNKKIKKVVENHLKEKKLILGICNGFQALIKSGLIPYGKIKDLDENDLTLYRNDSYHHIATSVITRVCNTNSPWTQYFEKAKLHEVLVSHGEGKLVGKNVDKFKNLAAFQYCDFDGNASENGKFNPNGSIYAIEGLLSKDGLVLGKMGHSERYADGLYKNKTIKDVQNIFENGVRYFKGGEKK